jgi:hypothetical protein
MSPVPRETVVDSRQEILRTAARLFQQRGYDAISVNDVAAAQAGQGRSLSLITERRPGSRDAMPPSRRLPAPSGPNSRAPELQERGWAWG